MFRYYLGVSKGSVLSVLSDIFLFYIKLRVRTSRSRFSKGLQDFVFGMSMDFITFMCDVVS